MLWWNKIWQSLGNPYFQTNLDADGMGTRTVWSADHLAIRHNQFFSKENIGKLGTICWIGRCQVRWPGVLRKQCRLQKQYELSFISELSQPSGVDTFMKSTSSCTTKASRRCHTSPLTCFWCRYVGWIATQEVFSGHMETQQAVLHPQAAQSAWTSLSASHGSDCPVAIA